MFENLGPEVIVFIVLVILNEGLVRYFILPVLNRYSVPYLERYIRLLTG